MPGGVSILPLHTLLARDPARSVLVGIHSISVLVVGSRRVAGAGGGNERTITRTT